VARDYWSGLAGTKPGKELRAMTETQLLRRRVDKLPVSSFSSRDEPSTVATSAIAAELQLLLSRQTGLWTVLPSAPS